MNEDKKQPLHAVTEHIKESNAILGEISLNTKKEIADRKAEDAKKEGKEKEAKKERESTFTRLSESIKGSVSALTATIAAKKDAILSSPGKMFEKIKGGFKGLGGGLGGLVNALATAGIKSPLVILGGTAIGAALAAIIAGIGAGAAGAAFLVAKVMPTFAEGLKSFENINGKNLQGVGIGVAGLGVGLVALGPGMAVLAGLNKIGAINVAPVMTMLTDFSAVEVDRTKVENNAKAMVSFGLAMAAGAAGGIGAAIGTYAGAITKGLGQLFGDGISPLDQLKAFTKFEVDGAIVKNNAEAMAAWALGMAAGAAGSTGGAIGTFAGVASKALGKLFGEGISPLDKLKEFGKEMVPLATVKNNAEAMAAWAGAMAVAGGASIGAGFSDVVGSISKSLTNFFGGKGESIIDKVARFGSVAVNVPNVLNNAQAMSAWANSMTLAAGGSIGAGISETASALSNSAEELLGGKGEPIIAKLVRFGSVAANVENIKNNALGMFYWSSAMADTNTALAAGNGLSQALAGTLANAANQILGTEEGEPIITKLVRFGSVAANVANIENNAEGLRIWSAAMANMSQGGALENLSSVVGAVASSVVSFFGGEKEDPLESMKHFASMSIDLNGVKNNADAVGIWGEAMQQVALIAGGEKAFNALSSIFDGMFGVFKSNPFKPLKNFGEMNINAEGIKTNASAINGVISLVKNSMGLGENGLKNLHGVAAVLTEIASIDNLDKVINVSSNLITSNDQMLQYQRANYEIAAMKPSAQSVVNNAVGGNSNSTVINNMRPQLLDRTSLFSESAYT
jgi:hypothetical protein